MNYNISKRKELIEDVVNEISFHLAIAEACGDTIFDVIIPRSYSLFLNEEDLSEIGNRFKVAFEYKYIIIPLIYAKSNKKAITLKFYKREK